MEVVRSCPCAFWLVIKVVLCAAQKAFKVIKCNTMHIFESHVQQQVDKFSNSILNVDEPAGNLVVEETLLGYQGDVL